MYVIHSEISQKLVGFTMTDIERDVILATLRTTDGNRTHAARLLGISIRTLRNKISQYAAEGIEVPEPGLDLAKEDASEDA